MNSEERTRPAPKEAGDQVASFHDLEVSYGRNTVLHDISAKISAGECVAVTGNNGSGKSTLIKALMGITPFQRGTIDLLGYVRQAGKKPRGPQPWSKVGYVPQRLTASGGVDASVTEVVQAGLLGPHSLRPPRGWKQKVRTALDRVGLLHREAEPFSVLSGGQQQRCLIARAMIRDPELVVFDEPLTGLDAHNRERLAQIIGDHAASGRTSIIVLHELGELRPHVTRELQIASGHIVHDGPCTHETHIDFDAPWADPHLSEPVDEVFL